MKIDGITEEARWMVLDRNDNLWVSTFNQGIIYVNFKATTDDYAVTHFDHHQGLPDEIRESTVECFNDQIAVFTRKGIYKPVFPKPGEADSLIRFEHDPYWGDLFTSDSLGVIRARQIDAHSFFLFGDQPGVFSRQKDSVCFLSAPFFSLNNTTYAYNHVIEGTGLLKYGTTKAFYVYDLNNDYNYTKSFDVRIRKVITKHDSTIYQGIFYDDQSQKSELRQGTMHVPSLKYSSNDIRFEFAAIFYEESEKNLYQYKVAGFDDNWSKWTSESTAIYTNIPEGSYTFMVKAKNAYGTESKVCSYHFVIKSPWYRAWYAYVAYLLLLIALVYLVTILNVYRLKQRNANLEHIVNERTIELEERQEEILTQNDILHHQRKELESTIQQLTLTQGQLVESEKMATLGILTAGIAHEINNPMNFVYHGTLSIESYLKEHYPESLEELQILFNAVYTGTERTINIVRALGNYSRSDSLKLIAYDIHRVIDDSLTVLANQFDNRIDIVKQLAPDLPKVLVNQVQIQHVFLNIIKNAIQAIDDSGQITISTQLIDGYVTIRIVDTGTGISEADMKHIFDPFFTTKEPGQGVGLGLSIAKKTIEQHQGTILFHSSTEKGTEVIITLPVADGNV